LSSGKGLGALLEALTGGYGTSLEALPSFAIVAFVGDEARIAVRGPIVVNVEGDSEVGSLRMSGARVTTWSESVSVAPGSVEIVMGAPQPSPIRLPIDSGVVYCDSISLTLRSSPVMATRPPAALPRDEPHIEVPQELAPIEISQERIPYLDAVGVVEPEGTSADDTVAELADVTVAEPHEATFAEGQSVRPAESEPDDMPADHTLGLAYDGLWAAKGAADAPPPTMIEGIPAFAPQPGSGTPSLQLEADDDHDGETLSVADIRAIAGIGGAAPSQSPAIGSSAVGKLLLSIGGEYVLDRGAVIGRKPAVGRFSADRMPHLITVPSPEQDISRSHVEIRCEGDHVFAVDLDTINGTRLVRIGKDPQRLHPKEPTMLVDGDVLDLGDAIAVTFVALS
jgi:hypothetical protein